MIIPGNDDKPLIVPQHLAMRVETGQISESLELLVGGIAHDFRNQITVIKCWSEVLIRRGLVKDKALEYAEHIQKAADKSTQFIEKLLTFSRQQRVNPSVVNLDRTIGDIVKLAEQVIDTNIKVDLSRCSNLGNVKLDSAEFQQALLTLLLDARDTMVAGGKLTIECSDVTLDKDTTPKLDRDSPGAYVQMTIINSCSEASSTTSTQSFAPLPAPESVAGKIGLGLSMVLDFLKQNRGFAAVESGAGQGTTVKIYLPRVQEAVESATPVPAPSEIRRGDGTILLVESDDACRHAVAYALQECGYTVLNACNTKAAIALGQHYDGPIDLIVSSLSFPAMTGPEMVVRIRSVKSEIPVLYLADALDTTIAGGQKTAPNAGLLVKPFGGNELVAAVQQLLRKPKPGVKGGVALIDSAPV